MSRQSECESVSQLDGLSRLLPTSAPLNRVPLILPPKLAGLAGLGFRWLLVTSGT